MTTRRHRTLSYTEIETALTCWARWDFAYGGRLAGSVLKPRDVAPMLGEGRAWGVAVAAWHENSAGVLGTWYAHEALREELERQAKQMRDAGVPVHAEAQLDALTHLSAMLDHYAATTEPLPALRRLEGTLIEPVPSRGASGRASPLYRFLCRVDGETTYGDTGEYPAGDYLVEFKLRSSLTDPTLILKQRQHRWYAWTRAQQNGRPLAGIIVDERLNEHPHDARVVQGNRKGTLRPSHDRRQLITPEAYLDLCTDFAIDPDALTLEALRGRMWQQRVPVVLRPDELITAGQELRDAAKLIRDLDNGALTPIRNASFHCNRCKFRAICENPMDELYVDTLFERSVPKRERHLAETEEAVTP